MVSGSRSLATINLKHNILKKENLIYGIRPLIEAIVAGKDIEKVIIQKGNRGESINELLTLLRKADVPYRLLPSERFEHYKNSNHQGVIGYISEITYQDITQLLPTIYENGEVPFILALDRITDVRNFGALARSASCAGVHAILIPEKGAAQINQDAIKTSAGALMSIPVCRTPNLFATLKYLKNSGLLLCSITEKGNEIYHTVSLDIPLVLLLGSEEDGISTDLLKLSDHLLNIPMLGNIASLNVSVAGAIVMFEQLKQRNIVNLK